MDKSHFTSLHTLTRLAIIAMLAPVLLTGCAAPMAQDDEQDVYDVVIYGGTSAGVVAAVQAKRLGRTAVLVCPEAHVGGLSSNGLGWTDSGNKAVIGGMAREFYRRLKRYYDDPGAWRWQERDAFSGYRAADDAIWVFEPHVAEATFEAMLAEAEVTVLRERRLQRSDASEKSGVTKRRGRITAITMTNGETIRGRSFIDATYEGDLLAAAGVSYTVGREANSVYGETLNGVQKERAIKHQFDAKIDPYRVPGDPTSGLLPFIHNGDPGEEGAGDHRVQAYCYRLCLTDVDANRVPFPKPGGYDPDRYELLLRHINAGGGVFCTFSPMPNGKTDTNNNGPFSTDAIGMNYDYPEASYERRAEILDEHERYQKGLFYFLANDPRVPIGIRDQFSAWGLAADEFVETGNWPHQIYVREARRMVSDFVMTERHLRGETPTPKSVGMGSYNMDSHNVQRYVAYDDAGRAYVRNEGDIQVNPGGPYEISYEALVPPRRECRNLLVPVCLSSSHIAYGSIRMEPVFMILGQSAATAAALALEEDVAVQDVDYKRLRSRLLEDGQVLAYAAPQQVTPVGIDPATLPGEVIDDARARRRGAWVDSASVPGFVGAGYAYCLGDAAEEARATGVTTRRTASVTYELTAYETGRYQVRLSYTPHANRASNAPVVVHAAGVTTETTIDQRRTPPIDGLWVPVAEVEVKVGQMVRATISAGGADGYVIADAAQLVRLD